MSESAEEQHFQHGKDSLMISNTTPRSLSNLRTYLLGFVLNSKPETTFNVPMSRAPRLESDHRADQWRPIESAPRDGTKILIAHAFDDSICISYWGCIRGHYGWKSLLHNSASGSQGDFCHDIAGWMPLPAPPEAK